MEPDDRVAITDLISLHGHLVDDVSDLGGGVIEGLAALQEAALALGDRNPVGHHVTNTVLTQLSPTEVRALSKGIGIMADGTCGSVTYEDTVNRTPVGWRITHHRKILARRAPLGR
jgi:hypothetical protein